MKRKKEKKKTSKLTIVLAIIIVIVVIGAIGNMNKDEKQDSTNNVPSNNVSERTVNNTESNAANKSTPAPTEPSKSAPETTKADNDIPQDIKDKVKEYEDFVEEYIKFMDTYKSASNPMDMLQQYLDYAKALAQWTFDWSTVNLLSLNETTAKYVKEALNKATAKLDKYKTEEEPTTAPTTEPADIQPSVTPSVPDRESTEISETVRSHVAAYEAFMDEYIRFLQVYSTSDDVATLLGEYMNFMSKYSEWENVIKNLEAGSLTDAEKAYINDAKSKVALKLAAYSLFL